MSGLTRRELLARCSGLFLSSSYVSACKMDDDDRDAPTALKVQHADRMRPGVTRGALFSLPYRLYVPTDYDSKRKYAFVLFLHSADARGTDNVHHVTLDLVEWITRAQRFEPTVVLAPHCPPGRKWVSAVRGRPFQNYDQSQVPEDPVGKLVRRTVRQVVEELSIDEERLYITGASMGAVGAWDMITRHPGEFAAAIPCTGVNDPSRASVIAKLPIWTFHGAKDHANPVENTRQMVESLRKLGSTVRYTEYADLGHNCWNRAYATDDLYRWLFVQRRGQRDPWADRAHR